MSVDSYLNNKARDLVIRDTEKDSIKTSINVLKRNLKHYFEASIDEDPFIFGSYHRGTILPRKVDDSSDIDIMLVLKDSGGTPQTYLNRIKKFVEKYYSTSSIKQSFPTIQLELNHIMFEIVPAKEYGYGNYYIPERSGKNSWVTTNPIEFNKRLIQKNTKYNNKLKELIRVAKAWNINFNSVGKLYGSYQLEGIILEKIDFQLGGLFSDERQIKNMLFQLIDSLRVEYFDAENRRECLRTSKKLVENIRYYEQNNMPNSAKIEIKKLIKD